MSHDSSPFFIVGAPRSGTTLMASFLSAHENIVVPPETHFFNYWLPKFNSMQVQDFWDYFTQSKRFSFFNVSPEEVSNEIEALGGFSARNIFHSLLAVYARQAGKARWGEKTPDHYAHLQQIVEWYPHAKIIWMIRDPRAVVSSLLKVYWASNLVSVNAGYWRHVCTTVRHSCNEMTVKLVSYESLLKEPEKTIESVCSFLGEEYSIDLLNKRSTQTISLTNRDAWMKSHLIKSLDSLDLSAMHKWQEELKVWQVSAVEHICRDDMQRYGYESVTDRLNISAKIFLKFEDIINRLTSHRYIRKLWHNHLNRKVHG